MNKLSAIDIDDIFGLVREGKSWRFMFAPYFAWAIDGRRFRGDDFIADDWDGMFLVPDKSTNVLFRPQFGVEMQRDELKQLLGQDSQNDRLWPELIVDMEEKLVCSLYFEQPIESWIPDDWRGKWSEPLDLLPTDIRSLWPPARPMPSRNPSEHWLRRLIRRVFWH